MNSSRHYYLGGYDLEMVAIGDLLARHVPPDHIHDRRLGWGAASSAYLGELAGGLPAVFVELPDDLPADAPREAIVWVDHHGDRAGRDRPSSLRQVFDLLGRPPDEWTREYALVEANDVGHVRGMLRLVPPATRDELLDIRCRDRSAQGITPDQEEAGRRAAAQAEVRAGGRLTVARLPHSRTAAVADPLTRELGGPGFETLLILTPAGTTVFGPGPVIDRLRDRFPGGWWGGDLPVAGYWGHPTVVPVEAAEEAVSADRPGTSDTGSASASPSFR